MTKNGENTYPIFGRRLAELRKRKGLTQSEMASLLTPKKTQAWISNVESGIRNINLKDLVKIAAVVGVSVGDLFNDLPVTPNIPPRPLSGLFSDISSRLPIEMPMYLQRDLGVSDPDAIDYQYASSVSGQMIFDERHPLASTGSMKVMVVERYYRAPKLDVSDLLTYTAALVPISDRDIQKTDRVVIKLHEPYDDLYVHPAMITPEGAAELTLSKAESVVFEASEFEIIGVVIMRRTMYRSSIIRSWLQREFGISKEENKT